MRTFQFPTPAENHPVELESRNSAEFIIHTVLMVMHTLRRGPSRTSQRNGHQHLSIHAILLCLSSGMDGRAMLSQCKPMPSTRVIAIRFIVFYSAHSTRPRPRPHLVQPNLPCKPPLFWPGPLTLPSRTSGYQPSTTRVCRHSRFPPPNR